MNEIYVRTDEVQGVIKDIKLTVNAWKLLFAVDGETELEKFMHLFEINQEEMENCVKELESINLIRPVKEDKGIEAIEESSETVSPLVEAETPVAEEPDFSDMATVSETEDVENIVSESGDDMHVDELEQLLSETEEFEEDETHELEMESIGGIENDNDDMALDDLISQIVEHDDEKEVPSEASLDEAQPIEEVETETENNEEKSIEELEGLLTADDEDTEAAEEEAAELDEEDILSDLSKDLEDFILDDDLTSEVDAPSETAEAVQPEEPSVSTIAIDGDRKNILIIDDSVVIRKMIEIAMENEPFNVIAATTGKEALSKIDEEDIDLIILDLILPDLNGLDILKAVKASSKIPVIILTGKDAPKELQTAKELGADEFLTKPFKDDDLVNKVKTLTA